MMQTHALLARHGHDAVRDFEVAARLFARANVELLQLAVAENVLLFPEIKDRIRALERLADEDLMYADSYGTAAMRASAAAMLDRTLDFGTPRLDERHVSGFSSTRAVLLRLLEPLVGKEPPYFLVPTPCWQGFDWVLKDALGGHIVRVESGSADGFALSLKKIEEAYNATLQRTGRAPVALVLTNPGNPVGRNIPRAQLEEITAWVLGHRNLQLVSDEIYAHAQVDKPSVPFTSVLSLARARQPDAWGRIHVAWGFAKDFGLSGFRIGLYLCRDEERHRAARKNAQWSPFDSYNSVTMASRVVGEGGGPGKELMALFKERLTRQHADVAQALVDAKIPFTRNTDAAVFFWLDLHRWLDRVPEVVVCPALVDLELLDSSADSRENRLRAYLACEAQVDLAPGTQFLFSEPGFFRMCYTAASCEQVVAGVERMGQALRRLG